MKLSPLITASAAAALLGGAAYAQQPQPPAAPTPGSVTGDWNGPHAPTDDKQYQDKTTAPPATPPAPSASDVTAPPAASTDVTAPAAEAPAAPAASDTAAAATSSATAATFANLTVTNGPIPDTRENRRKYGQPMSQAGKRSAATGN